LDCFGFPMSSKPNLMSMSNFRVLAVTNLWPTEQDPGYGGFVRAQMESLRSLGVDYDVLFIDGRASHWNYLRAIREVRRRVRADRYDLIHAHFGLAGLAARCQLRVPVVVSFLGDDVLGRSRPSGRISLYGRFLQTSSFLLARMVSAVIVKSAGMKSKLALPSAHVIPNGVDLSLFRPMDQQESRQALGLDPGKKYVLFPYAAAEERKRYDLIRTAVAKARARVPQLEVVHARGVPQERMPLYMNAADVLVLASMLEGSPNAVKEALAVNLPVVSVNVGDVSEHLDSVEGCFLVPREPEAIADKIAVVIGSGRRAQSREKMARLSIENVARQVVEVYAQVVNG
jgi:glycosyltransferase involved in cell wall biosynthesis